MTEQVEIVVFHDKSYVRAKEYLKLKEENEQLKQQVLYLEDNLRVARKDREDLRDSVANGLEEFIKEKPHTSLSLLANKEIKEENEQLRQQIDKLKEEKQYETCPYRSTDMGCDYCDYRDRDLKDEVEE